MSSIKTIYQGEIRRFRLDASQPYGDLRQQFVKLYKLPKGCELLCKYQDDEGEWVTVTSDVELIEALRVSQAMAEKDKSGACLKLHVESVGSKAVHVAGPVEEKEPQAQAPPTAVVKDQAAALDAVADLMAGNSSLLQAFDSVTIQDEAGNTLLHVDNTNNNGENEVTGEDGAANNVHTGVTCDMCGVSPLVGVRYKCKTCRNYDLCEACEAKEVHPADHMLMKIRVPKRHGMLGHWRSFLPGRLGGHRDHNSAFKAEFIESNSDKDDMPSVKVGQVVNQVWRVKNSGQVNWPAQTFLQFHNGRLVFHPISGANQRVAVPSAKPGEVVEIKATLTPLDASRKRAAGKFYLSTAEGAKFGPILWACASVDREAEAKSAPAAAPAAASAPAAAPVAPAAPAAVPAVVELPRPSAPPAPEVKNVQVAAVPKNFAYAPQLEQLEQIFGVSRRETLIELLATTKGNIQQVVDWMLNPSNK